MGHTSPLNKSVPNQPALLGFTGFSCAGKTTLITAILPGLLTQGLRIATLKHTHHHLDLDKPGSDSWRHKHAGAAASLLLTPDHLQLIQNANLLSQEDPSQWISRYCQDVDLVISEGFNQAPYAKIEVQRHACNTQLRCAGDPNLIAIVSDLTHKQPLPHFLPDDIAGITHFILDWFSSMVSPQPTEPTCLTKT
jgi:molybdopterin-guanine dinucleotide biosynthesis protein B